MVHPVEFESTTNGLKGRCAAIAPRMHLKNTNNLHHPTLPSTIFRNFFLAPEEGFEPPTV